MNLSEIRANEPVPWGSVDRCPACAICVRFKTVYHAIRCVAGVTMQDFMEVSQLGDGEHPHLHVYCVECGFAFTMQVAMP